MTSSACHAIFLEATVQGHVWFDSAGSVVDANFFKEVARGTLKLED